MEGFAERYWVSGLIKNVAFILEIEPSLIRELKMTDVEWLIKQISLAYERE